MDLQRELLDRKQHKNSFGKTKPSPLNPSPISSPSTGKLVVAFDLMEAGAAAATSSYLLLFSTSTPRRRSPTSLKASPSLLRRHPASNSSAQQQQQQQQQQHLAVPWLMNSKRRRRRSSSSSSSLMRCSSGLADGGASSTAFSSVRWVLDPAGDGDWRHIGYKVARPGAIEIAAEDAPVTVGRVAGRADIVIPVATVSGAHARLEKKDGRLLVTDLDSTNGTYINERRLNPGFPIPVEPGSFVIFGDIHLAMFRARKTTATTIPDADADEGEEEDEEEEVTSSDTDAPEAEVAVSAAAAAAAEDTAS